MFRPALLLGSLALLGPACAPKWHSATLVDGRAVAKALHDPVGLAMPFDPASVPDFKAPQKVRPCCAFGVDLKAKVGPVPVPLYENENILSPDKIGPHGYDKGELTKENNGLVYTCRGGFIDLAHVRDTGDNTLFLAMQIARGLPGEITIQMPDQGTKRRITIKAVPEALLARYGRWTVAAALASYVAYDLSIWHEVVTWYGWESTMGISEKLSAFSPEDTYSNVLGINLVAGIVLEREASSREQYDQSMEVWIREAMRRLGAVKEEQGRKAMKAVDGLWWDSNKRLPDWKLVTRRDLHITSPVPPWIVEDSLPADKLTPEVKQMCQGQPPPLPLEIEDRIGNTKIEDLVAIQFEFDEWIPKDFPLPADKGQSVQRTDIPKIVEDIRQKAAQDLGAGFDQPKVAPGDAKPAPAETKAEPAEAKAGPAS
ncbi:MAG TPA: DUF4056 domain-containing protein [Nannocystis sp.]|jgi:hypothetical protein